MPDQLFIRDLRVDALIGFHRHEQVLTQTVSVDLDIEIANTRVFESDRVADCIDYDRVAQVVRDLAGARRYKLVETLAQRIAQAMLSDFGSNWTRVSVTKLGVMKNAARVGVTIERRR